MAIGEATGSRATAGAPVRRRRSWARRRPTTALAVVVVVAALAAAAVVSSRSPARAGADASVAATVGASSVPASEVEREVAVIRAQPEYAGALSAGSTLALAAPVSPSAVASSNGDPDDLRISLAPVGGSGQRPYTTADLRAGVLTRLVYVSALDQVLAGRHVEVSAAELADGAARARVAAGQSSDGASIYDRLPSWYRQDLARRGADVEALTSALVGTGGITDADVREAYESQAVGTYTTVCLRSVVVASGGAVAATALGPSAHDDGCAPIDDWATDVAAAVRSTPAGSVAAPVLRGSREALVEVTKRTTLPFAGAAPTVRAMLSARYTDLVNTAVEDQLALDRVAIAPAFGTYESLGDVHGVIPPDALTPPPVGSAPSGPAPTPPQRPDPFD